MRTTDNPEAALASYLIEVYCKAVKRGYNFDRSKILKLDLDAKIQLKSGQLNYEFEHLKKKLRLRFPEKFKEIENLKKPDFHLIFVLMKGDIGEREQIKRG